MEKIREMQLLLAKIPKGKVTTYGIIARKLKIHPRAAGRLVGSNPDGVRYPCYRVVYSNGGIGGYTSSGGVRDKIRKLKRDGIEIKNNRIDLKKYLFDFHR
jgi:O6-methylguanine-DNA--protein-cysteine methyltransferase